MSGLMGAALNTPVGGFSGDVTLARTEVPGGDRLSGSSYRLAYSKNLPNTGTNFRCSPIATPPAAISACATRPSCRTG